MFPAFDGLVVSHRAHGGSDAGPEPHNLFACAEDLHHLLQDMGRQPDVLCGHSFGGKVALAYSQQALEKGEMEYFMRNEEGPHQLISVMVIITAWVDLRPLVVPHSLSVSIGGGRMACTQADMGV